MGDMFLLSQKGGFRRVQPFGELSDSNVKPALSAQSPQLAPEAARRQRKSYLRSNSPG